MNPLAVSVRTAADMLDISDSTIRLAIDKQQLPAFRVGRMVRIYVEDLKAWTETLVKVGSEDDQ